MTFQEMENALQRVTDNLIVQGKMLDRIDRKLEGVTDEVLHLTSAVRDLYAVTDRLAKISDTHSQQLLKIVAANQMHDQRLGKIEDQQAVMLGALTSLLQRMDAFIQGIQEGDGNPQGKT